MSTEMSSAVRFTKKRKEPTSQDVRRRRKKSVSFNQSVLMYRTLHINDFTDREIQNTWYSAEEMRNVVNDCVKIIASLDSDEGISSEECRRGLEVRTPEGQKRRTTNRFCTIDSVLSEQDAQWKDEANDTEKLRACSRAYSKPSEAEAYRFGLQDAKEAMNIYHDDELCSFLEQPTSSKRTTAPKAVCSNRRCMKLQHLNFHSCPNTQSTNMRTLLSQQLQYHSPVGRAA